MREAKDFCTCTDTNCANHPTRHAQGCDRCVLKCLTRGEIPSCFFHGVSPEMDAQGDYSYAGFADYVDRHQPK